MGDAARDAPHIHLGRPIVLQPQPGGELTPHLRRDPIGGPSRDPVHEIANIEQRLTAALQIRVRYVDQPGRHQRVQDRGVPQTAGGLLQVRDREVSQLPGPRVSGTDHRLEIRQSVLGASSPLGQHGGPQSQRQIRVTGDVTDVQQSRRHPDVVLGRCDHLREGPHRVVDGGTRVPERVPDLLGELSNLDAVVADEHHVQVGEGRELTAAVAADRDQRRADVDATRGLVGGDAHRVGRLGSLCSLRGGHVTALPTVGRGGTGGRRAPLDSAIRSPRRPGRRSAPAPRTPAG